MKAAITIILLTLTLHGQANDTLYFHLSNPWNTVKDPNGKYLRKCLVENSSCHVWDFNQNGVLVTESFYADTNFKTKLFCHKYYNEQEGWLQQTRCYLNGRLDGYFVDYDKKGDTTGYDVYKQGEVVKSWSLHPDESDPVLDALIKSEKQAEFPGGPTAWLTYLSNNIEYPPAARGKNISGQVIVQFTVGISGKTENVQVVKSLDPLLDKEAIRVIQKSPKWKPAMQNNKKVLAQMTQAINF
jgi:TonB family protein